MWFDDMQILRMTNVRIKQHVFIREKENDRRRAHTICKKNEIRPRYFIL